MRSLDSLTNLVAQLGTGKSKLAQDGFVSREMNPVELVAMYRSDWLARKIVDIPVFDMLRSWREWQADADTVQAIEDAEDRHQVRDKLSVALRMARLFGGSGVILGADVARPEMPLNINAVGRGGLKYITVVPRDHLQVTQIDRDPASPTFGTPLFYSLSSQTTGSVQIHPSRVLRFIGSDRLDIMTNPDGWGDSTLASIYDAIHHAALTQTGIAELVHEAKVDVIHIPDLNTLASTAQGEAQLAKRFTVANSMKSLNNMLLLGADEVWERKQTSFAGLPDILDRYLQIVSGASDIPHTRLLGMATKGLNNAGEGDLRNYYDMLAAQRQMNLGSNLQRLDDLLVRDALGTVPKDVFAEWHPMWQLSEVEKADIGYKKAQTAQIYINAAIMDEGQLSEGIVNSLIEDGTYPGLTLEAAINAALRSELLTSHTVATAPPANNNSPADPAQQRNRA